MNPLKTNAHGYAPETLMRGGNCPGCGVPFHTVRNPQRGPEDAVSTGITIDFEGLMVLCETCVIQLAQAIGWIDPEAGKARASDVRRAQRRDEAVKAASDARDSAALAINTLAEALDRLEDVLR